MNRSSLYSVLLAFAAGVCGSPVPSFAQPVTFKVQGGPSV